MNRFAEIAICSVLTVFLCLISFEQIYALNTSLEAGAGYDDNVPQIPDAQGSAFWFSQIKFFQPLFPDTVSIDGDLFARGDFHDYFRVEDNYSIQAGGSVSWPLLKGRLIPGITSDVLIYRDDFLEKDERNEFGAGGFIDWLASGRLTLGIRQSWRWADYQDSVITQLPVSSDKPGNHWGYGMGKGPGPFLTSEKSRDDRIQITGIQAAIYFTSSFQSEILLEHISANSSIDIESYNENALSASLIWMPEKQWEMAVTGSIRGLDYDEAVEDSEREDTIYNAGLGISYFMGEFELAFNFEWKKNDSSDELENYTQKVTQCGIIWSF